MWKLPPAFGDEQIAANMDGLADRLIPILAAALAAVVVVWQIRQADRHRIEDRKANAIVALTRMLYREVELASTSELWQSRALHRFQNGELYVEAIALLDKSDQDVGRWVAAQRDRIMPIIDAAPRVTDHPNLWPTERREASSIATDGANALLLWQRGDRPTRWFTERLQK
jgi:hypothetical protein